MRKETLSKLAGFYVGALVGGATVLLFTPQSGEETRAYIHQRTSELKERANKTWAKVLKELETATREILRRTEELSTRLEKRHTWDEDELARWDEELAAIEQAAEEALEEARMG
jgi:gas vesicle protein